MGVVIMYGSDKKTEPLEIVSRGTALRLGLTRYYSGVPCAVGHIAQRLASNGRCVKCNKIRNNERMMFNKKMRNSVMKARAQINQQKLLTDNNIVDKED
jgi:hypothetical protein